ncbi:MAG: energy-coupled thiamine transporter ThiT [Clostridium sp.]|nr:energy-coupled thiamine transporter ThiT [Clostridium sp.]
MSNLIKSLNYIKNYPTSIITLVGVLILVLAFMKIRKVKLNTKMIAQIGIALALSMILQMLRIYHFPQGGAVTIGSYVPILLIALVYGPEVGILAGFLHGMLTLIVDPYIMHPIQLLFDYPLPSMSLGLAGFFRNNKIVGSVVAIFIKYVFHFISGVVFFGSFAPKGMSAVVYSLSVNGPLMIAEGGICIVIIAALPLKVIEKAMTRGSISN